MHTVLQEMRILRRACLFLVTCTLTPLLQSSFRFVYLWVKLLETTDPPTHRPFRHLPRDPPTDYHQNSLTEDQIQNIFFTHVWFLKARNHLFSIITEWIIIEERVVQCGFIFVRLSFWLLLTMAIKVIMYILGWHMVEKRPRSGIKLHKSNGWEETTIRIKAS